MKKIDVQDLEKNSVAEPQRKTSISKKINDKNNKYNEKKQSDNSYRRKFR